ncbi:MAG: exopolyphosphatase, partial [Pedobacter sp.]
SGDKEAALINENHIAENMDKEHSYLYIDVGGGSTEFIICNEDRLLWKRSYDIGAARLMQAYFNSDPISQHDQQSITSHLNHTLTDLLAACELYQPSQLIGSAGAFETFASMMINNVDIKSIRSAPLDIHKYKKLSEKLIESTHAERDAMPDLIKLRVDMIVMASLITDYVIAQCNIKEMSLSTYDLKMGVLHTL